MKAIEPFDIEGLTPIEAIEKISATILELTHQGVEFGRKTAKEDADEVFRDGYKEGYDQGYEDAKEEIRTK